MPKSNLWHHSRKWFPALCLDRDSNSEPVELKSLQLYNREGGFYILAVDPKISETAKLKVFANRMGANLTECRVVRHVWKSALKICTI